MEHRDEPYIYELLSEWLVYIRHRYSQDTCKGYKCALRKLWNTTSGKYEFLTPQKIEQFLQNLPLKANSKNTYLNAIKSFCRYCEEHHDLPNPTRKVKYLKRQPWNQRVLTKNEFNQK